MGNNKFAEYAVIGAISVSIATASVQHPHIDQHGPGLPDGLHGVQAMPAGTGTGTSSRRW
jgi:hypothetical protein